MSSSTASSNDPKPTRLVRAPTEPQARAYGAPEPRAAERVPDRSLPARREVEPQHEPRLEPAAASGEGGVAPIESIVGDLEGAPRYLLPLIALGVMLVLAVAVLVAT